MDIREIRRANLETVFNQFVRDGNGTARTLREFSEVLEINAVHLSQMKNGLRNVGAKIARRVEVKLHKPVGWMDHEHLKDDPVTKKKRALELALELYRDDPKFGSEFMRTLKIEIAKRKQKAKERAVR